MVAVTTFLTMKNWIVVLFFLSMQLVFGQERKSYWVEFSNKGTSFDPFSYFDPKAIERRIVNEVNLWDSTDFPVNERYERSLEACGAEVIYSSRWLNASYVKADLQTIERIRKFQFVKEVLPAESEIIYAETTPDELVMSNENNSIADLSFMQIHLMNGFLFPKNNITGKGVRIAVFDGGFPNVDVHRSFEHIRNEGRIVGTFDFTKNRANVYRGNSHGLATLSNIGGYNAEKQLLGLAPDAEYLLAVTEINLEILKEEVWWVAAAEWADKNGAHIINSSLGYTEPRYAPMHMNGRYTMVSRAANIAASKGILVINSAGNEGATPSWQIIGAPADADSVLSIGGVNPENGIKINFSSFGPTAHRKLKPNVVASGTTVAASGKNGYKIVNGTSFSAPLVSGFAACVMQMKPGLKTMEYFNLIQQSAHLYPYYDYAHGYGVPQADFFFDGKPIKEATFSVVYNDDSTEDDVDNNLTKTINENAQNKKPKALIIRLTNKHTPEAEFKGFDYFYFHLADANGELVDYEVLIPEKEFTLHISHPKAVTFRAYYKGYYFEMNL
ncbi:subtilase family protein [Schleiferia thermophila]|uniref:Subtilase family protein n=2 Tax=Schleiferia thermophila TaxID=884107 RepID=A0A369A1R7_9FLAO|nr:subtilase family protein [Schleiferia thermophila]